MKFKFNMVQIEPTKRNPHCGSKSVVVPLIYFGMNNCYEMDKEMMSLVK